MFKLTRRAALAGVTAVGLPRVAIGQARQKVRVGVPTKTYWPTVVCETAIRQKLFEKEGLECELTIYRGGAECFEALAAGAAVISDASRASCASTLARRASIICSVFDFGAICLLHHNPAFPFIR